MEDNPDDLKKKGGKVDNPGRTATAAGLLREKNAGRVKRGVVSTRDRLL